MGPGGQCLCVIRTALRDPYVVESVDPCVQSAGLLIELSFSGNITEAHKESEADQYLYFVVMLKSTGLVLSVPRI